MDELMRDLGVQTYEELFVYLEENPDEQIVIELKQILDFIDFTKGDE